MARRTLLDYQNTVEHAVGGTMDSRHTSTQMVNDAGRFLCRMTDWKWLERPPIDLTLVADAEFIVLPADFGAILSLSVPDGVIYSIHQVGLHEIESRRNYSQFDSFRYFVALAYPGQGSRRRPAKQPRLEVYPTSQVDFIFTTMYRGDWVDLEKAKDVPIIAREYERLLVEICRAMARGIEDDEELLETPSIKTQFNMLLRRAGLDQSSMGEMRGGAVQDRRGPVTLYPHRQISR